MSFETIKALRRSDTGVPLAFLCALGETLAATMVGYDAGYIAMPGYFLARRVRRT